MIDNDLRKELKFHQLMLKAICIKLGINEDELRVHIESVNKQLENTKETNDNQTDYPSVDDAPEWKVVFKVNTSEGVSIQKIIQKAWTEKQAIFLGRTEQLFSTMNELVKAKQIQAKWNILESEAAKIVV
jgi:hypothetical protein